MSDQTALMANHDARMKELRERDLERRIRLFTDAWKPEDRRSASDFEAQLIMLVRQIYADAQEPLLKHIGDICRAMPMIMPRTPDSTG
jgi:hypothetical protein